jgi:hypothetical protein
LTMPCSRFAPARTGRSSAVIKAVNHIVTQNAVAYRKANGVLTLSVITALTLVNWRIL